MNSYELWFTLGEKEEILEQLEIQCKNGCRPDEVILMIEAEEEEKARILEQKKREKNGHN